VTNKTSLKPNKKLQKWFSTASLDAIKKLRVLSGISEGMFRQYTHGRRIPKADAAATIETAMNTLSILDSSAPTPLNRGDLCPACKKCPYLQQSLSATDDLN